MAGLADFVGIWISQRGAPYSDHRFTWSADTDELKGEWVIEASAPKTGLTIDRPRYLMPVGSATLDCDRLLFRVNDGPSLTEFRLVSPDEAVVGAASDRLPAEFSGPEFERSIEGHRVRLRRVVAQS